VGEENLLPFNLFPKQEKLTEWILERETNNESGLVLKSRDVGLTWICAAYAIHGFLFREGFTCGFGSRKMHLVDKLGDPSTIFQKLRFILENLPKWMLPKEFNWKKDSNYARLLNPKLNSAIIGEGGDEIGRGGRTTIYFVDEAAFLKHPELADSALSANTNCRIEVSTPNGVGNPFYDKLMSGKFPFFTLHWKDDPRKDQHWYDNFKRKYGPVKTAQEVDLDFAASLEGVCIPAEWVRAAVDYSVPEDTVYKIVGGLDVAGEGSNETVMITRKGPRIVKIRTWNMTNTTDTAHKVAVFCIEDGIKQLNYDGLGIGSTCRGTWSNMEHLAFYPQAVLNECTNAVWPDLMTSKEKFQNLRAELYYKARMRFEKTYENSVLGKNHPIDECISIPNDPKLIMQLSVTLIQPSETGKIKMESKVNMKTRGVKSPDLADALIYSLYDDSAWAMENWSSGEGEKQYTREDDMERGPMSFTPENLQIIQNCDTMLF
jgi:hypothetical protein